MVAALKEYNARLPIRARSRSFILYFRTVRMLGNFKRNFVSVNFVIIKSR